MKRFFKTTILVSVFVCLTAFPLLVNAGLVPCGTSETPSCELCHFLILIRNIFDFILKILVPLAILFAGGAGVLILISRGSQLANQGKKILTSVVIGIVIALLSWTIVNTIIVALANPGTFPLPWHTWNIPCLVVVIPLTEALQTEYTVLNDTGPLGASPGDTIRYSITYLNTSSENLSDVAIVIDYDQEQVALFPEINLSPDQLEGGDTSLGKANLRIDDDRIIWDVGDLNSQESKEIYYDFILSEDSYRFFDQSNPSATALYYNIVAAYSDKAQDENFTDPLQLILAISLFAERQYYLISDNNGDGESNIGDELRYNIEYYNSTPLAFNNTSIISDYNQLLITITNINGGGINDGDKITWSLGNLEGNQPSSDRPGCIGYNFIVNQTPRETIIPNIFYIISDGGILESHNDTFEAYNR